jgi:hypothetical protein
VEVDLDFHVGQQVAGLSLQEILAQRQLFVGLVVHEDPVVAVVVRVGHRAAVDIRPLDLLVGRQTLVALLAAFDVLDLDLHVGAAAAADVHVIALQHAPDALVEFQQVAGADFSGEDLGHGFSEVLAATGRRATCNRAFAEQAEQSPTL